jgi:hypothetical protein
MDHHCNAIGVCVALRNHKIFLLFRFYTVVLMTIYGVSALAMIFIGSFESFPHHLVLDIFVGGTVAVLVGALFAVQFNHILIGRTALELELNIVVEDSLTKYERLTEVFGPFSIHWVLPTLLPYEAVSPFKWEKFRKRPATDAAAEAADAVEADDDKEKKE